MTGTVERAWTVIPSLSMSLILAEASQQFSSTSLQIKIGQNKFKRLPLCLTFNCRVLHIIMVCY